MWSALRLGDRNDMAIDACRAQVERQTARCLDAARAGRPAGAARAETEALPLLRRAVELKPDDADTLAALAAPP